MIFFICVDVAGSSISVLNVVVAVFLTVDCVVIRRSTADMVRRFLRA